MLYVTVLDDDHGGVPCGDVERLLLGSRDEVVERAELAVALHAELGIGVTQVVENLELAAYGTAFAHVHVGIDEVFDAAVGAFCYLEVNFEDEVVVVLLGDDVAAVAALGTVGLLHLEHAVLDAPAFLGEGLNLGTAPAVGCLAVPEEFPSFALFLFGEDVVGCGSRGRLCHYFLYFCRCGQEGQHRQGYDNLFHCFFFFRRL